MINVPHEMIYKENINDEGRVVLVYDFIHDIVETFQTYALCWVPSSNSWLTTSVAFLTPVNKIKKKKLNEGVNKCTVDT